MNARLWGIFKIRISFFWKEWGHELSKSKAPFEQSEFSLTEDTYSFLIKSHDLLFTNEGIHSPVDGDKAVKLSLEHFYQHQISGLKSSQICCREKVSRFSLFFSRIECVCLAAAAFFKGPSSCVSTAIIFIFPCTPLYVVFKKSNCKGDLLNWVGKNKLEFSLIALLPSIKIWYNFRIHPGRNSISWKLIMKSHL